MLEVLQADDNLNFIFLHFFYFCVYCKMFLL